MLKNRPPLICHADTLKYRPEIDGLRALAVLSVVAFHFFPDQFKGGFIGVDVFFVISGYLISSIIFIDLSKHSFQFLEFYSRRIRRIFPALLIVLSATYIVGWNVLFAQEYKQLGKHVAGGASFIANFVLWNESGYFDNSAITKPLLHLWSLGIEEQFYIVWPLVMVMVWRQRWNPLLVIVGLLLISFQIGNLHNEPIAAFYSPQSRIWELLIGSLIAYGTLFLRKNEFYTHDTSRFDVAGARKITSSVHFSNLLAMIGMALIFTGFLTISKKVFFPGYWALLPTVGTAFVISAGEKAWLNQYVLSHKLLVWFGKISFPLYLWHWPLLSFISILENESPPYSWRFGLIALSVLLAWVTYELIEKSFRFGANRKSKTILLLVLMPIIGLLGYNCYQRNGLTFRSIVKQEEMLSHYNYFNDKSESDFWGEKSCFLITQKSKSYQQNGCEKEASPENLTAFLIGDSHSAYLSLGLNKLLVDKKYNLSQFSAAYCPPLYVSKKTERCAEISQYILQKIKQKKPDLLIIFGNYSLWANDSEYPEQEPYEVFLRKQIAALSASGVGRVLVIGQIPAWTDSLPTLLVRRFIAKARKIPVRTYEGIDPSSLDWDEKLKDNHYPQNVTYISLKQFLCNEQGCLVSVGPNIKKDLIVFDQYAHLTQSGAEYLTKNLIGDYILAK